MADRGSRKSGQHRQTGRQVCGGGNIHRRRGGGRGWKRESPHRGERVSAPHEMGAWEEIRDIGLFTRRDEAVINKGTALSITLPKRGKMKIILLGDRGAAGFDWIKPGEKTHELPMYRGNAYGGAKAVAAILRYFGAGEGDIDTIIKGYAVSFTYKYSKVSAKDTEDGREIRIDITETLSVTGVPIKKTDAEI